MPEVVTAEQDDMVESKNPCTREGINDDNV